jgi:DNA-binding SARP family transcriptional activator
VVEGGLHRREKLGTLFWPESQAKAAKATLRTTLARLRSVLQVAHTPIISEGDLVGFDFSSAYVLDLDLVGEAQKSGQPAALHQVLELYRGDFLTAFSLQDSPEFDDWVSIQRQAWRQQLDTIFEQLSQNQRECHILW